MATHNLYSEHADTIESVLAYTRRAHRLSADDGDEFTSWARLRLLEDECAVLRKFGGLSSFKAFIVVVINRLFLDWRIKEWGKWRPTPMARRLGPLAVELERLVLRDRVGYAEATQLLISKGLVASERDCDAVWEQLRRRAYRMRVSADLLVELPSADSDPVAANERRQLMQRVVQAMHDAMAKLLPQDQLIFKMRYHDGVTVARIAKLIDADQKRLYRRFEQIVQQLRAAILAGGLSEDDIRGLFEGLDPDDGDDASGSDSGNGGSGPSRLPNAGGLPV